MADKIEDGGPAFPTIHGYVDSFGSLKQKSEGLSLRDWFAGQVIASCDFEVHDIRAIEDDELVEMAAQAYRISDAMLKARKGEL